MHHTTTGIQRHQLTHCGAKEMYWGGRFVFDFLQSFRIEAEFELQHA
jgi:hypothetical protein